MYIGTLIGTSSSFRYTSNDCYIRELFTIPKELRCWPGGMYAACCDTAHLFNRGLVGSRKAARTLKKRGAPLDAITNYPSQI